MKVITRYRLADLIGTLYETSLKGEPYYEYRIRYNKKIVGRSYSSILHKEEALKRMLDEMEVLFDSSKLGDIK